MGAIQDFTMGLFAVIFILVAAASLYTSAVGYGGWGSSPDFPLANQSVAFQNRTADYTTSLMESFKEGQNVDPTQSILDATYNAGSAIVQTVLLFLGDDGILGITSSMIITALGSFDPILGGMGWIAGLIIAAIGIFIVLNLVNMVMRYDG